MASGTLDYFFTNYSDILIWISGCGIVLVLTMGIITFIREYGRRNIFR